MTEESGASPIGWVGVALTAGVFFFLFLHPHREQWRWGRFGHGAPVSLGGRLSVLGLSVALALVAFGLLAGRWLLVAALAFVAAAIADSVRARNRR